MAQDASAGLALGAVADDYTGATDLANSLARQGLRTIQTIGIPREGLLPDDVEAVVVALKSRSIPAAEAVSKSLAAHDWLSAGGCGHVLFKICSTFDSTDAGNIGPVTDALRAATGADTPIVCPAFPGAARTVYLGHLFVGDRLLSESPLRHHPLNPMHDPDLVRVLARQSEGDIGLIPYATVEQGADAVAEARAALAREGKVAAIADALTDRHLEILGEAAARTPFSTGGSGLGAGIAAALVRQGRAGQGKSETLPAIGGRGVILSGSCSVATLDQIDRAEEAGIATMRLDPMQIVAAPDATFEAIAGWVAQQNDEAPVLIAASAPPDVVASVQERFGRDAAGHAIEALLARCATHLVETGVRRLVIAGGETSGAVTDALGVEALLIGPEIAPGVPATHALGGIAAPLGLVLKSGNFGGPDFFAKALSVLE